MSNVYDAWNLYNQLADQAMRHNTMDLSSEDAQLMRNAASDSHADIIDSINDYSDSAHEDMQAQLAVLMSLVKEAQKQADAAKVQAETAKDQVTALQEQTSEMKNQNKTLEDQLDTFKTEIAEYKLSTEKSAKSNRRHTRINTGIAILSFGLSVASFIVSFFR